MVYLTNHQFAHELDSSLDFFSLIEWLSEIEEIDSFVVWRGQEIEAVSGEAYSFNWSFMCKYIDNCLSLSQIPQPYLSIMRARYHFLYSCRTFGQTGNTVRVAS